MKKNNLRCYVTCVCKVKLEDEKKRSFNSLFKRPSFTLEVQGCLYLIKSIWVTYNFVIRKSCLSIGFKGVLLVLLLLDLSL